MFSYRSVAGRVLACIIVVALAAHTVSAQSPAYITFNKRGWIFAPAVSSGYIFGYLAWANTSGEADSQATVTGDNVTVFWCQRETFDTWTLWGWDDATVGEAGTWVRQLLTDPTVFSLESQLPYWIDDAASTNPPAPEQIQNGLFFDDPLQSAVVNAPDPGAFLNVLAMAGYQAAPGGMSAMTMDAAEPCDPASDTAFESMLNSFTRTADLALFGESMIASSCVIACVCTTTPGAWTAGAWTSHTRIVGARTKCDFEREWSRPVTRTGVWDLWIICPDCSNSWTEYRCEAAFEDYETPHVCAGAPQSTTATSFISGHCAGW